MSRQAALSCRRLSCLFVFALAVAGFQQTSQAYGPQGFDTIVIDAGHGGYDHGGGPGQRISESIYTLDTALRLQRACRSRGFRTVMTRTSDVFVTLRDRVVIGSSYSNAVFVSVHYNSGQRLDAHGYETYYYRSDSFGLASRLHAAQLSTLNTEDRHIRRDPFYVLRNPTTPAVLCEGGFLTNPEEAATIMSASYRERWAQNIADALVQQRRSGDPGTLGYQPPVTTQHYYGASHYSSGSSRHGGRGGSRVSRRGGGRHGRSSGSSSHGRSGRGSSSHGRSGHGGSSHGGSHGSSHGKSSRSSGSSHSSSSKKHHH